MTRLRTQWGSEWSKIEQTFAQLNAKIPLDLIKTWQQNDWAHVSKGHLILTETGALMADKLAADLFIV
jgi:coproporphyrinogen III oxidase-like Fe-S oxidoreductase